MSIRGKWNRIVSDCRCYVGGRLIALGSIITDASVISRHGTYTWRRDTRRA